MDRQGSTKARLMKMPIAREYTDVGLLGMWNGYEVWEYGFRDEDVECEETVFNGEVELIPLPICVGPMLALIGTDGNVEFSGNCDKTTEILNYFYPSEDFDDDE